MLFWKILTKSVVFEPYSLLREFWWKDMLFAPYCLLQIFWPSSGKTYFLISHVSFINVWLKHNSIWPLRYCFLRVFWTSLIFLISLELTFCNIEPPLYLSYFVTSHNCLKLSETNVEKAELLLDWMAFRNFTMSHRFNRQYFTKCDLF